MSREWKPGDRVRLPPMPKGVTLPHDRGTVEGTDEVTGRVVVRVRPPVPKDAPGSDVSRGKLASAQPHELQEVASLD